MIYKRWEKETDRNRFRALRGKPVPPELKDNPTIIQRDIFLLADWMTTLHRSLSRIAIPLVARAPKEAKSDLKHRVHLWSGTAKTEYSWHTPPPSAWKPLARLFIEITRILEAHQDGSKLKAIRF